MTMKTFMLKELFIGFASVVIVGGLCYVAHRYGVRRATTDCNISAGVLLLAISTDLRSEREDRALSNSDTFLAEIHAFLKQEGVPLSDGGVNITDQLVEKVETYFSQNTDGTISHHTVSAQVERGLNTFEEDSQQDDP